MTAFTIIGAGNMGTAIGAVLTRGGATVTTLGRADLADATVGDVVVLAVPHTSVDEIIATLGDKLAGKTIVDITNPLDFATFDALVVPAGSSFAAELQAKLPTSRVIKAFNTNFAATLATGTIGAVPTTVLVAGDDADAKAALLEAVTAAGVASVDAGALSRAHELEAIGFLQLTLAVSEKIGWTGGFALQS